MTAQKKFSTITIRETNASKTVRITADSKPGIDSSIIEKWQSLIDTIAKVVQVPSGLIMRLNENTIQVLLKSNTEGNPYTEGEEARLIYGLYCETVIGTQEELVVADARKSPVWGKDNPDMELNMISYLGYPINWPDGECFGTVCLLDKKENHYNNDFKSLVFQIKQHIETDLQMLVKNNALREKQIQLEQVNNIKARFLSLISHDVRGSIGTLDTLLKILISDFDNYEKPEILPLLLSLSKNAGTSFQTLESLLDWSKNDMMQLIPNRQPVNIIDIIENLVDSFQQAIDFKSITLLKEYYSRNAVLAVDEKMIRVIFRNILSNAIKYTRRQGTILIRVRAVGDKHIIEIQDSGIGMDQSTVQQLFKYKQSRLAPGTEGESSAGIGLMLVKEFLDKHHASIEVRSELGIGSEFKITI